MSARERGGAPAAQAAHGSGGLGVDLRHGDSLIAMALGGAAEYGSAIRRHSGRSIVLARSVALVRTFTPIVAGTAAMSYRTFLVCNITGGVLWGSGVTALGYLLGRASLIRDHIDLILVGIVALLLGSLVVEVVRGGGRADRAMIPGAAHGVCRPRTAIS